MRQRLIPYTKSFSLILKNQPITILHTLLLICALLISTEIGHCRSISIEIGPIIHFDGGNNRIDVPNKSPHSFDDFHFSLNVKPNRLAAKDISLGIKYLVGRSSIKEAANNPLGLSHISSHLWTAFAGRKKHVFKRLSHKYDIHFISEAGIGIISEIAGFTPNFRLSSDGIVYNVSTAFTITPTATDQERKIEKYYFKLDLFFVKDTFDYENLHVDQDVKIAEFRKLVLSEIGLHYRWFSSVSVKLFGRLCHYDKSSRFVVGSGLIF